jgi:hypothetical protein
MAARIDLDEAVIAAWKTNNRVTAFLFENLPAELWPMIEHGGKIPASGVAWLKLPVDVVHFLSYFVADEGHHRGEIVCLRDKPASVAG